MWRDMAQQEKEWRLTYWKDNQMNGSYLSVQQKVLGTLRLLSLFSLSMDRTMEKARGVAVLTPHPGLSFCRTLLPMAMQPGRVPPVRPPTTRANREREEVRRASEKGGEDGLRRERSGG
jgi:hypothetical protein